MLSSNPALSFLSSLFMIFCRWTDVLSPQTTVGLSVCLCARAQRRTASAHFSGTTSKSPHIAGVAGNKQSNAND